ncbi:MAG: hypothetical protein R3E83_13410 [Burkholderiaceae bacterium]
MGINRLTSAEPGYPNSGAVFHDTAVWLKKSLYETFCRQHWQSELLLTGTAVPAVVSLPGTQASPQPRPTGSGFNRMVMEKAGGIGSLEAAQAMGSGLVQRQLQCSGGSGPPWAGCGLT